ncbi:MAG: cupin domain-containing protein [Stenotrophobium sp.]
MKPIINIADASRSYTLKHGERFEMSGAPLAELLGAKMIGANLTTVPPGKAAFPFHHHYANEEHFFILSGSGTLRTGAETFAVKSGDYIVNTPGGPDHAHQLINTGSENLVYLALSTMQSPEVVGYPDSDKTGVRPLPYGAPGGKRYLIQDALLEKAEYWDGEDGAQVQAVLNKDK